MTKVRQLLTLAQAAGSLGIHPNTLRGWADRGIVPVVRFPSGHRRFHPSDIAVLRWELGLGDRQREDATMNGGMPA